MNAVGVRVVKLGGSLLESSDWATRLAHWLAESTPARTLLLVGGGPPVDAIRQMASMFQYEAEFLHWLCVDAMDISHRLVEQQLHWPSLRTPAELQTWLNSSKLPYALMHPRAFYRIDNYQQLPVDLPLSWDTTSDSLAALLAHVVEAEELVLIKSLTVAEPYDWPALSQAGIVDTAFPQAIQGLTHIRLSTL